MTLASLVIHTGERALLSICPQSKEKENHLIGLQRGASCPPQYTLCQQCLTRKLREIMPKMQGYLGLSLRNTLIETVAFMRVNSYQGVSLLQTQTPLSCVRVPCQSDRCLKHLSNIIETYQTDSLGEVSCTQKLVCFLNPVTDIPTQYCLRPQTASPKYSIKQFSLLTFLTTT